MKIISEVPQEVGRLDMELVRPHLSTILRFLNTYHLGGFEDGDRIGNLDNADRNLSFLGLDGGFMKYGDLDSASFRADLKALRLAISEILEMTYNSIYFSQDGHTSINLTVNLPTNSGQSADLFHIDHPSLVSSWRLSEQDEYTPTEFLVGEVPFDEDRTIRQQKKHVEALWRKWAENGYDPAFKPKENALSESRIDELFNAGIDLSKYQIYPSREGSIYRLGDRTLEFITPELDQIKANVHRRGNRRPGYRMVLEAEFESIPEVLEYLDGDL